MQTIKIEIANQINSSVKVKGRLAYELNKHMFTIEGYIRDNNTGKETPLLYPSSLKAIAEELGLSEDQLLETAA